MKEGREGGGERVAEPLATTTTSEIGQKTFFQPRPLAKKKKKTANTPSARQRNRPSGSQGFLSPPIALRRKQIV